MERLLLQVLIYVLVAILLIAKSDILYLVMVMGFSSVEARLGLRSSNGNVQKAIAYIMERQMVDY